MQTSIVVSAAAALVLIYNQLTRATNHTLLAMVVMGGFVFLAWYYVKDREATDTTASVKKLERMEADGRPSGRVETSYPGQRTLPASFPKKGFKFLRESQAFLAIVDDIRVLRLFDKARYSDILVLLDRLQKIYMYILAGRYDAGKYIGTFMDTRDAVLEQMYSWVFAVPSTFDHIYGIDPAQLIKRNIEQLTSTTRTMAQVLKSYAEKTADLPHIPDVAQLPAPHDTFDPMNRLRLP